MSVRTREPARLITHVVGARPNFMKAAPVLAALQELGVGQRLIHTGQHYSESLSDVFFTELEIPSPDINLGVGSGTHAQQTAATMVGLEQELTRERPDVLVLYGDVNSTLAGALVAAKSGVPIAHVEAGLRSFDRSMPEEVNRVVTDRLSTMLFATSPEALVHLGREGVDPSRVFFVGNPMIDTLLRHRTAFDATRMREALVLSDAYGVVTLHRPGNVDEPEVATVLVESLLALSARLEIVVPLHPRGRERLAAAGLVSGRRLRIIEPLGYLDFLSLVTGAAVVVTDSGGVQEETTFLGVPCLTVRPNTERPITITHGTNRLVAPADVARAASEAMVLGRIRRDPPPLWDGRAGRRIAAILAAGLESDAA